MRSGVLSTLVSKVLVERARYALINGSRAELFGLLRWA
jgi:hypothetical protein